MLIFIYFYYQRNKLYVPVVTLSAKGNQKLSKFLSKGFEKSVCSNEYKTKLENKDTANKCSHYRQKYVEMEWEQ